jgi:hypothetical protein
VRDAVWQSEIPAGALVEIERLDYLSFRVGQPQ